MKTIPNCTEILAIVGLRVIGEQIPAPIFFLASFPVEGVVEENRNNLTVEKGEIAISCDG